jgi:hypothetical protein
MLGKRSQILGSALLWTFNPVALVFILRKVICKKNIWDFAFVFEWEVRGFLLCPT